MEYEERDVPTAACRFAGGPLQLAATDANDPAARIEMLARTSQPITHFFWGRVVHDMDGMQLHKDILPADYNHEEEVGFLDTFAFDDQRNLIVSGKLVPTSSPDDRARKIIERSKGGVPYEASIDFSGELVCEEVSEGFSAPVNGYQFEGPGVIIREWPLRGVAVCPYGADMNTSTSVLAKKQESLRCKFVKSKTITETKEVSSMSEVAEQVADQEIAVVDVATETEAIEAVAVAEAVADAPAAELRAEMKRFRDAFGDRGLAMLADGLTFDQARDREMTDLRKENTDLKAKLAARRPEGEMTPVSISTKEVAEQKKLASLYNFPGQTRS